jgi:hypothetical protein
VTINLMFYPKSVYLWMGGGKMEDDVMRQERYGSKLEGW